MADDVLKIQDLLNRTTEQDPRTGENLPVKLTDFLKNFLQALDKEPDYYQDALVRVIDFVEGAMLELLKAPASKLVREHAMVPVEKAVFGDSRSMMALMRLPGRTVKERLAGRPKVMDLTRIRVVDLPENRVVVRVAKMLMDRINDRPDLKKHPCFSELYRRLDAGLYRGPLRGVRPGPVQPVNRLMFHPLYSRVRRAMDMLERLDATRDKISVEPDYFLFWAVVAKAVEDGRVRPMDLVVQPRDGGFGDKSPGIYFMSGQGNCKRLEHMCVLDGDEGQLWQLDGHGMRIGDVQYQWPMPGIGKIHAFSDHLAAFISQPMEKGFVDIVDGWQVADLSMPFRERHGVWIETEFGKQSSSRLDFFDFHDGLPVIGRGMEPRGLYPGLMDEQPKNISDLVGRFENRVTAFPGQVSESATDVLQVTAEARSCSLVPRGVAAGLGYAIRQELKPNERFWVVEIDGDYPIAWPMEVRTNRRLQDERPADRAIYLKQGPVLELDEISGFHAWLVQSVDDLVKKVLPPCQAHMRALVMNNPQVLGMFMESGLKLPCRNGDNIQWVGLDGLNTKNRILDFMERIVSKLKQELGEKEQNGRIVMVCSGPLDGQATGCADARDLSLGLSEIAERMDSGLTIWVTESLDTWIEVIRDRRFRLEKFADNREMEWVFGKEYGLRKEISAKGKTISMGGIYSRPRLLRCDECDFGITAMAMGYKLGLRVRRDLRVIAGDRAIRIVPQEWDGGMKLLPPDGWLRLISNKLAEQLNRNLDDSWYSFEKYGRVAYPLKVLAGWGVGLGPVARQVKELAWPVLKKPSGYKDEIRQIAATCLLYAGDIGFFVDYRKHPDRYPDPKWEAFRVYEIRHQRWDHFSREIAVKFHKAMDNFDPRALSQITDLAAMAIISGKDDWCKHVDNRLFGRLLTRVRASMANMWRRMMAGEGQWRDERSLFKRPFEQDLRFLIAVGMYCQDRLHPNMAWQMARLARVVDGLRTGWAPGWGWMYGNPFRLPDSCHGWDVQLSDMASVASCLLAGVLPMDFLRIIGQNGASDREF